MKVDIVSAIQEAASELGFSAVDFVVEHPSDIEHGDYASNVALVAAGELKKRAAAGEEVEVQAPREIAEQFLAALSSRIPHVDRIEIAGPGFLNFYLGRDFFKEKITTIHQAGDTWGRSRILSGQKIIVEYTDPNPFKEFHIGHLFTNAVGESIARLQMVGGAEVKRVNYQGDVGLHVAHAVWGMQQLGIAVGDDFTAADLGRAYALGATTYKEDEAAAAEIRRINKHIYERDDDTINALYDAGRATSLAYFETIYKKVGTHFDAYFFESEAGPRGKELVLSHPEVFTQSDGAHVFAGETYGLHTRVFLNKEGLPTYEAKELALAKMKEEKLGDYDLSIISTANEVSEYFKVLLKAMSFVYPELAAKTEHIGHGTVRLATGKMSSRTGDVIPALDFISEVTETALARMRERGHADDREVAEQVALGAIKYVTLKGSILQDTVFNKEQALSFEGDSGPYLQYTYARAGSVLEKAAAAGVFPSTKTPPSAAYPLERLIYQFPEVIEIALEDRAPHKVATFLTELASSFNSFYAEEQIADPEDQFAPYKAALTEATRTTLKNGLFTLGIEAPERM